MTTETISGRHLASRVAGRRSPNLAGAIYGTIVATGIVAGMGERHEVSAGRALWILLASGVFFWAAHVYASLLATRIVSRRPTSWVDVRSTLWHEWPLFQASLPLAVPLVLALFGVFAPHMALGVATVVGVLALVAWGVAFARHEGYGLSGIVAAASLNAAVGLFIVALKVAVR